MALYNANTQKNPLRKARLAEGCTQRSLEGDLGVADSTIANWELWNAMPSKEAMLRIQEFCGSDLKPVKFYQSWKLAFKRHQKAAQ